MTSHRLSMAASGIPRRTPGNWAGSTPPQAKRDIPLLGEGSAPHGVIIDDAGTAWVTDGGLNAIVAVDPVSLEVTVYPLPDDRPDANLNTASFDGDGMLWFTGQNGIYGCVDPDTGELIVFDAPEGRGTVWRNDHS